MDAAASQTINRLIAELDSKLKDRYLFDGLSDTRDDVTFQMLDLRAKLEIMQLLDKIRQHR